MADTLNKTAILDLANFIERAQYKFDMTSGKVRHECGSAGCIGGHAAVLWPSLLTPNDWIEFDRDGLYTMLGLSFYDGQLLCFTAENIHGHYMNLSTIDRAMAVAALRRLAETGRIYFATKDRTPAKPAVPS